MGRFPRSWVLVAIGLVMLGLSQPLLLLVMWKLNIDPKLAMSATDLGAIMGAIFTAGGLIVAIVSVYTMASIEKVTQQAVEPVLAAIPDQIDSRIRRFLEAYGIHARAQDAANAGGGYPTERLRAIDHLVHKALGLEPSLSGIYAFAGRTHYIAAAMMYWRDRVPEQFDNGYPLPARDEFPAILVKAAAWLTQALDRCDGDTGEIAAELAEVHGMMHASCDDAIGYVVRANSESRILPSGPRGLMMLFGCCRHESDLLELARVLDLDAPLTIPQIEALLLEHQPDPSAIPVTRREPVSLLVVLRFDFQDGRYPVSPGVVQVLYGPEGYAMVSWRPRKQPGPVVIRDGIPQFGPIDAQSGYPSAPPTISIAELAEQLAEQFYVIGTFARDRFPERAAATV